KAAVLTHEALRAAALAVSRRMEVEPRRDRWLACLPVAHIGGMAVVVRALVTGTPLDLHAAFDPDAVNRSGATLTSLVPTMLDRGVRPELFRMVLVGGDADRRERGPSVVHTYGMTETVGGIVHRGRPLDGVEVRTDDDGEIHVRGPMLLRCYRHGTDPKDGGGWLATGDLGAMVDGELEVHGRMTDVIITGGEKVQPFRVEQALRHHPDVKGVAVAGEPDAEWGQRVVAWVVPRRPGAPPTLESLRDMAKEALPAYCAPKDMVLVAELPKTALGKTRRAALCR
ncbi:MAG TPA: fatty acid--CoA ligase family protein, partial [Acidimicrobiales bacterium]|nr:fatty acid--CoA ligase family protein [Acidimicrobiales bacterium]